MAATNEVKKKKVESSSKKRVTDCSSILYKMWSKYIICIRILQTNKSMKQKNTLGKGRCFTVHLVDDVIGIHQGVKFGHNAKRVKKNRYPRTWVGENGVNG